MDRLGRIRPIKSIQERLGDGKPSKPVLDRLGVLGPEGRDLRNYRNWQTRSDQRRSSEKIPERGVVNPEVTSPSTIRLHDKSPFHGSILRVLSTYIKLPSTLSYEGTSDLIDHVVLFANFMYLEDHADAVRCKHFPTTLKGIAHTWF